MSRMKSRTPAAAARPAEAAHPIEPPASGDGLTPPDTCSTTDAAKRLGMAVRSVQMMVDRGELQAWKTPGGHRRILRQSIEHWLSGRSGTAPAAVPAARLPVAPLAAAAPARHSEGALRVLLIEDSKHFQNLVSLLVRRELPAAELHVADDGIAGLALVGRVEPHLLLIDILLPGIDGAALITSLRSHPEFASSRLVVITSLDEVQRAPYAFALQGVPVVHKSQLAMQLPPLLAEAAAYIGVHATAQA